MMKPLPPPWDRFVPAAQRILVWAAFFAILWVLRPFFFLVFLTFMFGYVLEHLTEKLQPVMKSRRARVVTSFLWILAILVAFGFTIAPEIRRQAVMFPTEIKQLTASIDGELSRLRQKSETLRDVLPEDVSVKDMLGALILPEAGSDESPRPPAEHRDRTRASDEPGRVASPPAASGTATDPPGPAEPPPDPVDDAPRDDTWRSILPVALRIVGNTAAVGTAFLLSLLFSLLIVLDLPNIAQGLRHLHDTRAQFVYDEISDNIFHFGRTLGRALEAQLMIAILNTAMTAIGLSLMKIPSVAFLSAIVFVCSFIPVVGVFISSVPICLLTFASKGTILWVVWMILFITLIHLIEAYILNPKIYGAHLRMNPVLVLSILFICQHLFGMWGLVLGVPTTTYFYRHVICRNGRGTLEPAPA